MFASKKLGKPLIVKIVGDYAWEQGRQRFGVTQELDDFVRTKQPSWFVRALQKIEQRVAKHAAQILVPSMYLKQIVETWGVAEEKINVIHNAVYVEKIGSVPPEVLSLPRPLVVSVGRLVPWKNMSGIIDAMATIPNASLAVVGDGPLRKELIEHGEKVLSQRYVFTGALSHADTLAVMKSADVFVLNSSYEGFSHLLIEALALGVPIVATAVGGNAELIADGENGVLVESGSVEALTSAIKRVTTDTTYAEKLRSAARTTASRYTVDTMLAKTSALLQSL
jgi:glycosyltransferase involved in cell wall biosynthesis